MIVFGLVRVAAAALWLRTTRSSGFLCHAELIQVSVKWADAGMITNLMVAEFQGAKAEDRMVEETKANPRTAHTRLAVMRSRRHLLELETEPLLSRRRASLEHERLSAECAQIRAGLVTAQVNCGPAQKDFCPRREGARGKAVIGRTLRLVQGPARCPRDRG